MPCTPFVLPDGSAAGIICTRGPRRAAEPCQVPGCTRPHVALCDWKVSREGRPGTCDLRICAGHRWPIPGERDKDLCPAHRKLHEQQTPQQLTLGEKVAYVRQESSEPPKGHVCHADGCEVEIAPAFLMCSKHWRMVPKPLQAAVWRYFRPGQEQAKDPSPAYLAAMLAAVRSVAEQEGRAARPPRGGR